MQIGTNIAYHKKMKITTLLVM